MTKKKLRKHRARKNRSRRRALELERLIAGNRPIDPEPPKRPRRNERHGS